MNHQKIYDALIQKAKSENRIKLRKNQVGYVYYDNHHIIPVCLNGSDEPYNRQLLTDKEHYFCHKLLTYIYKGNRKLACAFHKMTYGNIGNHIKSARDYAYAKELMRTVPISEETKKKIGKSHEGFIHSEESKQKMSKSKKGKKKSDEYKKWFSDYQRGKTWEERCGKDTARKMKQKQSERRKEYNTKNKKGKTYEEQMIKIYGEELGIIKAKEQRKKLSESKIGRSRHKNHCIYCNREIADGNYKKYHGEKCKYKPGNENKKFTPRTDKCKYCEVIMDISNLHRYHDEKCKFKKYVL
jgi:hypothetical protein